MKAREGTWAEVEPGVVIQDPKLKHWLVTRGALGSPKVEIMSAQKELRVVDRRPAAEPIAIMEVSEAEAIQLATEGLPAHLLRAENDRTLPLRAMRFRMDHVNTRGSGAKERIRSHIEMYHGVHVGDGWKDKKTAQLVAEHAEMHSAEHMTMTVPHHHEEA